MNRKMVAKIIGIHVALLLTANAVVAVSPTVRQAIEGLPMQDQIFFLANEIDAIKLRQDTLEAEKVRLEADLARQKLVEQMNTACEVADSFLNLDGSFTFRGYTYKSLGEASSLVPVVDGAYYSNFLNIVSQYHSAKSSCDSLKLELGL